MIFRDYQKAKSNDKKSNQMFDLGISTINALLPKGVRFDSIDSKGLILFDVNGEKVPTISLSDGYRSVLALGGDLVWRLITSFPNSPNPLHERGVVLIDELDIHLHPSWQRQIAGWLRTQFPNLQFIVTTHSPFVAAGAGEDATTYRLTLAEGAASIAMTQDLFAMSADDILKSDAFGMLSTFSPQTQDKLDRYEALYVKGKSRKAKEESEFKQLSLFMEKHNPHSIQLLPSEVESEIENYIKKMVND